MVKILRIGQLLSFCLYPRQHVDTLYLRNSSIVFTNDCREKLVKYKQCLVEKKIRIFRILD